MSLRAAISAESQDLTSSDISSALGCLPSTSHDVGSAGSLRPEPRERSLWSLDLSWRAGAHAGTEGLSQAIEALGTPFADRLANLKARGCDVVLSVVQELADEPESTGLHLSAPAIEWLARAGAALDIDQYVIGTEGG